MSCRWGAWKGGALLDLKKKKKNCTDGGGGEKWAEKWVKVEVNRWSDKFKSFFAPAENWKDCCRWWAERKMKQPSTWNKDSKERKSRGEKRELRRWAKARGREERVSVKPHGGQDTSTRLISISFKWYHSWGVLAEHENAIKRKESSGVLLRSQFKVHRL